MATENSQINLGDSVRLRSGPYAGRIGVVVRVGTLEGQGSSGALVMVKLQNGRINPCYMNNLEKADGPGLDKHYEKTPGQ